MATQTEVRDALKKAADAIAKYVEDAAKMTVETKYVEIGAAEFKDAKLAAMTEVKLDGDSQSVLPMHRSEDGNLAVDVVVYDLHQQNVQAAIDYRSKMLASMLGLLKGQ